ncbi:hypothetical protein [Paenibacillus sp. GCM10027626]|uniref:hypothetical protein n=1 Tax=Paenibacillus sp. GCM10027626 TaxID=3273411 RepID=UPI00363C7282
MPYHSIDLQASIPRTPEAGALHNQALQKPVADQTKMAADAAKETELKRSQNEAVEKSSELNIRERPHQEGRSRNQERKRASRDNADGSTPEQHNCTHPYKGKHIDISL